MMRANIYTAETFPTEQVDAVEVGLFLVGEHLGGIAVQGCHQVRLPMNDGVVRPSRVGYDKLDPFIDLHVFVADISTSGLGISISNTGIAWVRPGDRHETIVTTTAHEVGHAVGFVMRGSRQSDPASPAHCADRTCVMHRAEISVVTKETIPQKGFINRLKGATEKRTTVKHSQDEFCSCCVDDMQTFGHKNIAALRHDRVISGKILPKRLVKRILS
jgi:hypothetical protein